MVLSLFSAHDLSVLMWTLGVVGYLHADVVAAVQDEVIKKVDDFEPSDVARLLHGFATLRHNPVGMFHCLAQRTTGMMSQFSAEDVTLLLISVAKLGVDPGTHFFRASDRRIGELVPKVKRVLKANKGRPRAGAGFWVENAGEGCLNSRQIVHIMWALGVLDHRPAEGKFMNAALRHLELCIEEYLPEELTTALWACTRLKTDPPPHVLVTITGRLQQILPTKLNDDDYSLGLFIRALSCLATLVIRQPSLLPTDAAFVNGFALRLAATCIIPSSNLRHLKAPDLSSLVIALANLELGPLPAKVSERLQEAAAAAAKYMQPSVISKVAWASVRLHWQPGAVLWDSLAVAATEGCCFMPPESLVQLAWSFAAVDRPYPELGRVLVDRSLTKLTLLTARDKARLAWAFAQMSRLWHVDKAAVLHVVQSLHANEVKQLDSDSVSALIWACGRVKDMSPSPILLDTLAANMAANLQSFSWEQMTQARAILAKLGCRDASAMEAIGREIRSRE
jgi:hypothetical protein